MASKPLNDLIIGGPEPVSVPSNLIAEPVPGDDPNLGADDTIVLDLADLLPDESGEVVLFTGEDLAVNLLADQAVSAAGTVEHHVTAGGVDVTGLQFYVFENGVTIYSESDLLISASPEMA